MNIEQRARRSHAKHLSPFPLAVLLMAGLALGGCHHEEQHEEELPHLAVTKPLRQDTEITNEYVCQIHAIQRIEVRALDGGYLSDIFVDEGQSVHRGQRLFQILPVVYQAEVDQSSAELRAAEVEFANTQALRDGNVVSENELALSRAHLERAKASRELARAHLGFASLDAPFDGILGRLRVRRGSLLEEGELLTEISDNSEMWVYFNVSETQYLEYKATHEGSAPVHVQLRMANGRIFDQLGTVQTIESDFNNQTGTIAFRAGFPNPNGLLRHGETGTILMTDVVENALLIPQKAVYTVLDKSFVFVVSDDGVLHTREITLGSESIPHLFVVTGGLDGDDSVLLDGLRRVNDGDHINPARSDPKQVLAELDVPAE
jgi:membrane fusion protein (multidrug efflux system)